MIKIGVLGAGHLGKIHLRILKTIPAFELLGFYEPNLQQAAKVAEELEVKAWDSLEALVDAADAVDVVTATQAHFEVASLAVKRFKHIFVEKPVTSTVEQARQLISLVQEANVKAQVGHVERFNPAYLALQGRQIQPLFIEGHRLALWNPRGSEVSVVMDLMIHDLDLVLKLAGAGLKKVSASGAPIICPTADVVNARLEFHNGCVANLTASRISLRNERRIRIWQPKEYIAMDFLEKKTEVFSLHDGAPQADEQARLSYEYAGDQKYVTATQLPTPPVNAIQLELEGFAEAILKGTEPPVTLTDAFSALQAAQLIEEKLTYPG